MTKAILNTRAVEQQKQTQEVFEKHGLQVINFPCLEIATISEKDLVRQQFSDYANSDVYVFTSQNAVIHAFKIQPQWNISNKATVIAVGKNTAEILEQYYSGSIWIPEKHNSEGVIELLKGLRNLSKLALITGKSGRNQIQNFCQANAIKLFQIDVYQRQIPAVNPATLQEIQNSKELLILVTSVTTLIHFKKMISQDLWEKLKQYAIISASDRISNQAEKLGFNKIITTNSANPEKICLLLNDLELLG